MESVAHQDAPPTARELAEAGVAFVWERGALRVRAPGELLPLVQAEVQRRAAALQHAPVPLGGRLGALVMVPGLQAPRGACGSCGEALPRGETGDCDLCNAARRVRLRELLEPLREPAPATPWRCVECGAPIGWTRVRCDGCRPDAAALQREARAAAERIVAGERPALWWDLAARAWVEGKP